MNSIIPLLHDLTTPKTLNAAIEAIRAVILAGELAPGRPLPSERALASRFGISRTTVRAALARLEAENLVTRQDRRVRCVKNDAPSFESVPSPASGSASGSAFVSGGPDAASGNVHAGPRAPLAQTVAIISDIDPKTLRDGGSPGWSWSIYRGAAEVVIDTGRGVLPIDDAPESLARARWMASTPPCGLVVITARAPVLGDGRALLDALRLGALPVAAYGDTRDWPGCATVASDHAAGSRLLVEWLARHGRRRILCCGRRADGDTPSWALRRREGYEQACRDGGLPVLPGCSLPTFPNADRNAEASDAQAHMAAGYLLPFLRGPEPVDALMAASDAEVPSLVAACRLLGRTPGRDIDVAGYDHYWAECKGRAFEPTPPAVTVDKRNVEIGRALGRQLLARIEARPGDTPPPTTVVVAPELAFPA